MVAMEMMVVVAMPVHHHKHSMSTALPRGRHSVTNKQTVTTHWKRSRGTPDQQHGIKKATHVPQSERGRSSRAGGVSNGGGIQYTAAATPGGTWYSVKPILPSPNSAKAIPRKEVPSSPSLSSSNSVTSLKNTSRGSSKSFTVSTNSPAVSENIINKSLPVGKVTTENHRAEHRSHRPQTPVLLPSQVRWPQRESGEYVCGKSDGSLGYKTARLHARSRSHDCSYRTPLGTARPTMVQDVLMSRYDEKRGLGHLQEDEEGEDELGPLERDEHGVWHGGRSPNPSRASQRRSPSPPRRRHRDKHHGGTPVLSELGLSQDESPKQRARIRCLDNLDSADGTLPRNHRQRSRQSSREPSLEDLSERRDVQLRSRPPGRDANLEDFNHIERREASQILRQHSRHPSSDDSESVNSEIAKSKASSSEDTAPLEDSDSHPRRRQRTRQSSDNHYGTHSEPPLYQPRRRRSRQSNSEDPISHQHMETEHNIRNGSNPSTPQTQVLGHQPRQRQGSRRSSLESLAQSQLSDSRSERSNSKTPSTEDLVPNLRSETETFTERHRSRSRQATTDDVPKQRSETHSSRHSSERQRSQSVQPRLEDYARNDKSGSQRQGRHSEIPDTPVHNKHKSALQSLPMTNQSSQDRNFDGSRHTHASRQRALPVSSQIFSLGQNSRNLCSQKQGPQGAHLWDGTNISKKHQYIKNDKNDRPKRPGYTTTQTRIFQFEASIHKTNNQSVPSRNSKERLNLTSSASDSESHGQNGSAHGQRESLGCNAKHQVTANGLQNTRQEKKTSHGTSHSKEQVGRKEKDTHQEDLVPPRPPPPSPGSPHSSLHSAFTRGLRFKSKPTEPRSPPILCDGPRRSLGSQRRRGNRKRVQIVVEETELGHDAGCPDEASWGEHGYRSSPQKVLLGHIASLSHSFSFGSRRKHQARNAEKQSLVVPDGLDFQGTKKLNGAPSATSILHPSSAGPNSPSENGGPLQHGQRSARWAIGFDRLLDDCAGRATFTEFLKKEVSQENIEFWLKCEDYKQINDEEERQTEAQHIWKDHLGVHASDSVNVDSVTLIGVEEGLQMAPLTLFDDAQTHIFQLMKQDSYPRFLKSELYKKCVVAEMEGKPLPYPGTEQDRRCREEKKPVTKSKSMSMDKGKRRQSFFPFSWNKSKSEKRLVKNNNEGPDPPRWAHKNDDGTEDCGKDENKEFCRVILPDGSTTVFHAKSGTPIRVTLKHLCQRRTLSLPSLEVFQHGTEKPLDLTKDVSLLASKSIWVEQRVLFQADLPSRRPLVVKAKPGLSLRETLKPILPKYNLKVDNMVVHMVGSDTAVDLDAAVSTVEGQRLLIQTEEDFAEWGGFSHRGKLPMPSRSKSTASLDNACDDDHLVSDVMDGKLDVAHLFDEHGVFDPDKKHDKYRHEDGRGSGLFDFIRRNSAGEKDASRFKNKNGQPATISGHELDRPRPRQRPPIKDREAENLFEQLNKMSGRLDDQRVDQRKPGDLELPDFLKVDKTTNQGGDLIGVMDDTDHKGSFRTRERRNSDSSILDSETSRRLSQSQDYLNGSGSVASPTLSSRIPYMDNSFSQNGVVPTHAQAEEAFATARHYPGSPDLSKSWVAKTSVADAAGDRDKGTMPRNSGRRRYSPRSRTPDAKRTLLHEANGYLSRSNEGDEDLSVRPLVDNGPPRDPSMVHMEIASYSPPVSSRRSAMHDLKPPPQPPQPPPRKTLTTPKKFLPTATGTQQQGGHSPRHSPRHSQQNSTSSELSHHSDSTTATTHSGSSGSAGGIVSGGNVGGSPSSTPSPTTHDLFPGGDSSHESAASPSRTRPQPPPRPSRRLQGGCSGASSPDEGGQQVQKALDYDQKDSSPRQKENDMQVSYV